MGDGQVEGVAVLEGVDGHEHARPPLPLVGRGGGRLRGGGLHRRLVVPSLRLGSFLPETAVHVQRQLVDRTVRAPAAVPADPYLLQECVGSAGGGRRRRRRRGRCGRGECIRGGKLWRELFQAARGARRRGRDAGRREAGVGLGGRGGAPRAQLAPVRGVSLLRQGVPRGHQVAGPEVYPRQVVGVDLQLLQLAAELLGKRQVVVVGRLRVGRVGVGGVLVGQRVLLEHLPLLLQPVRHQLLLQRLAAGRVLVVGRGQGAGQGRRLRRVGVGLGGRGQVEGLLLRPRPGAAPHPVQLLLQVQRLLEGQQAVGLDVERLRRQGHALHEGSPATHGPASRGGRGPAGVVQGPLPDAVVRGRELAVGVERGVGGRGEGRGGGRGGQVALVPLAGRGADVVHVAAVVVVVVVVVVAVVVAAAVAAAAAAAAAGGEQALQLVMLLPQLHHPARPHALAQPLAEGDDPLSDEAVRGPAAFPEVHRRPRLASVLDNLLRPSAVCFQAGAVFPEPGGHGDAVGHGDARFLEGVRGRHAGG